MSLTTTKPKARRDGLILQELPDELLIYDQRTHRAHCLNASAASVFRIADGSRSIDEIARAAGESLGAPLGEDLVWLALEELDANDLLEAPLSRDVPRPTRREVLAVGAASGAAAVMLPMVLAITAPTPAYAASGMSTAPPGSSTAPPPTPGSSGPAPTPSPTTTSTPSPIPTATPVGSSTAGPIPPISGPTGP
jgi:hypothetical protein